MSASNEEMTADDGSNDLVKLARAQGIVVEFFLCLWAVMYGFPPFEAPDYSADPVILGLN